jgi:hypothetical protein
LANITAIKESRTARSAGHVARMGEKKMDTILLGKPERDHFGDLGVDERIILKYTSKKEQQ